MAKKNRILRLKKISSALYKKVTGFVDRRPIQSFFFLLVLMFALIIAGNLLRRPAPQAEKTQIVRKVAVYHIGSAPTVNLQGQVEKAGVIQITALTPGVVQNIYAFEGSQVAKGSWLVALASNYQGGNALSISRQLAEKQNELIEVNYPLQKDLIGKQRDLANNTQNNFDELRSITDKSISETQSLISLNDEIITTLNDQIDNLGDSDSSLPLKQLKSQFLSANLQLNNSLRQAQYQVDTDNPPTRLAQNQKDIALKQLEIQEKSLDLNREISKLQVSLAQVAEASMFPSAPFAATVERIWVRAGEAVNPGTELVTLSAVVDPPLTVNVYLTKEMADTISRVEPSTIHLGSKSINLLPRYVSREAVQGDLYAVVFDLPQEDYGNVTDKGFVTVQIPVGYAQTSASIPYIPLDAVYQTQEESFIYLAKDGKAEAVKVTLGSVTGRFVQVESGLGSGDTIILDRNVVAGEPVVAE